MSLAWSTTVYTTDSEWREIVNALNNDIIFPSKTQKVDISNSEKTISGYLSDGQSIDSIRIDKLFPEALCLENSNGGSNWYCGAGKASDKYNAEEISQTAYSNVVQRASATPSAAEGIDHKVAIMPDGRVAAVGNNVFGECNVLLWDNIKQVSCGNWHTVGLKNDGTLVACGSNVNKQCDIQDIDKPVKMISCGRYHTAILTESGKVIVKGKIEQNALSRDKDDVVVPIIIKMPINKDTQNLQAINEALEHLSVGELLAVKKVNSGWYRDKDGYLVEEKDKIPRRKYTAIYDVELINTHGECIGKLEGFKREKIIKKINKYEVTVESVIPLSKKAKSSKYGDLSIRIDYGKTESDEPGEYRQTKVDTWPAVKKIKSIFDAVVGITADDQVLIDGFCPCRVSEIKALFFGDHSSITQTGDYSPEANELNGIQDDNTSSNSKQNTLTISPEQFCQNTYNEADIKSILKKAQTNPEPLLKQNPVTYKDNSKVSAFVISCVVSEYVNTLIGADPQPEIKKYADVIVSQFNVESFRAFLEKLSERAIEKMRNNTGRQNGVEPKDRVLALVGRFGGSEIIKELVESHGQESSCLYSIKERNYVRYLKSALLLSDLPEAREYCINNGWSYRYALIRGKEPYEIMHESVTTISKKEKAISKAIALFEDCMSRIREEEDNTFNYPTLTGCSHFPNVSINSDNTLAYEFFSRLRDNFNSKTHRSVYRYAEGDELFKYWTVNSRLEDGHVGFEFSVGMLIAMYMFVSNDIEGELEFARDKWEYRGDYSSATRLIVKFAPNYTDWWIGYEGGYRVYDM